MKRTVISALLAAGAAFTFAGPALAGPVLVDFDPAPFAGTPTGFMTDGFDFIFTGGGDGGDFAISVNGGEGSSTGIDALSGSDDDLTVEEITVALSGGGSFTFNSIWFDNFNSVTDLSIIGMLGGGTVFSEMVAGGESTVTGMGGGVIDTLRIVSSDINLVFDSLNVDVPMRAVPEPGTLGLLALSLAGLGFAGRRRRASY